ncbi:MULTISPECIES: pyrroline-5-carboxylate reductase [Fusobacterium]|jgi:pyrroline-5-carboxylate reductase|uniref:Pyrroline-5-carboxylate reductase n=1 Tax=Fusobacterium hominis TaxID=2764326 RepID=A0A7G9GUT5_9FUSO|nr:MULTISPECIES: pyrroline-5-carboxylate reductase [Fusobacterium]QNM14567.1 pyrroline-5-carboxylate reductase [Fusobacterium hominis]
MKKIGFIGCGNMGEAFLKGIINSQMVETDHIYVYDKMKKDYIKELYNVNTLNDEVEVVKNCDIIFLAVKPNVYFDVIDSIKDAVNSTKIIVAMAPGISMESILDQIDNMNSKIVRTMPNLPLMVQEGCIAYAFNENVDKDEKLFFKELFEKIGVAVETKEELFDAVIGASGSSPAFVFMFIEALADAAVYEGLPRSDAYKLVGQTLVGCGKLFLESGKHPGELKDNVCSPGGTTIVGVKYLEENGFRGAVIKAATETIKKSKEMSKENN